MVLGAAIGAGINALSSSFASNAGNANAEQAAYQQFMYQSALQHQSADLNYRYSKKLGRYNATEMPTFTRQGLEKAGYNPMLAVSNGMASGSNASFTGTGSSVAPDYAANSTAAMQIQQAGARLANETAVAESQSDLNYANADRSKVEKAIDIARLPYVDKQAKADYIKTEMESASMENQMHFRDEQLNLLAKELELKEKLGIMGIDATRYAANMSANASNYSADKALEASKYSSNISELNNIRQLNSTEHNIGPKWWRYTKRISNWK